MPAVPWRRAPDGIGLSVRVTPKGGRDAIDGAAILADGSCVLKLRVRAAAHDGEANAAVIRLLAGALGVPARAVELVAGASARNKRFKIAGSGPALAAILEKIQAGTAG
jgi:uncharacterized protein YggU (UPF0235/DUF167 family)